MKQLPTYEVYALRYAEVLRRRHENFIETHDDHDTVMPMDYFVWLIRGENFNVLVDTGFNQQAADARGRTLLRCPIKALEFFGLYPSDIEHVIVTHMHYDHAGNVDLLPTSRFHLQESEVSYATGRYMLYNPLRKPFNVEDVLNIVRGVYQQRVVFHKGDTELAPGIELIHIGGHTQGLQSVRVNTERGWVVLASDASHYYDNIEKESPFPAVWNVGEMLEGYDRLRSLVPSADHIVPGHDPAVCERYPSVGAEADMIFALHLPPRHS